MNRAEPYPSPRPVAAAQAMIPNPMNLRFLYMSSRWLYPIELRPLPPPSQSSMGNWQAGHISWPNDQGCQTFEWRDALWCLGGNVASSSITLHFHHGGDINQANTTTYQQVFDPGAACWGEDPLQNWGRLYRCYAPGSDAQFLLRIQ